ncbi:Holliday junction branch migration protein RuvA [Candidatus Parcubacteria bacterium]|nr:Holliday junction branch migration protein RuvA [Candidatus Parcubacteria bacterium]
MIASISGTVSEKLSDTVIVEVGGVGYELFLTTEDWGAAKIGGQTRYYVYEQIREDTHNLYGFGQLESKQVFTQLLSVSGIGPKVALAILSAASLERLRQAVAAGDPELLKGVSGVGKKTAERIVMELRGKLGEPAGAAFSPGLASDSAYQALVGLGYPPAQAAEAIAGLPGELTGEQERVKAAIKGMGR